MKILVTGGTGFIASWVIKYLLEDGHDVNTTVREINNKSKTEHLTNHAAGAKGVLTFFEADLLQEGSFEEAVKECDAVIHTASPFFISGIKDARKQLIEPAVKGTRNVMQAVEKEEKVKKVVVTSSVAAVYGDNSEIIHTAGNIFTEEHWNQTSSEKHQAYNYSKTAAEKEAWRFHENQKRWELAVINPGFVLGPSLTKRTDSTSINFIYSLLNGRFKQGIPNLYFGIVDVRDVAKAHVQAATKLDANGRHILVAESMSAMDITRTLQEQYDDQYAFPKKTLPKALLYLFGPFMGFSWSYVRKNIGIPIYFDNTKAQKQLGITFKNPRETIKEQAAQLIEDGLVQVK
ncbi:MAG: NAD-dependent epimerase/dehydratase family protein [Bacteroidales bacterium]|nr:NAD-dependent epimerase/dehydratase family protein [Bacteroidales bacterium]